MNKLLLLICASSILFSCSHEKFSSPDVLLAPGARCGTKDELVIEKNGRRIPHNNTRNTANTVAVWLDYNGEHWNTNQTVWNTTPFDVGAAGSFDKSIVLKEVTEKYVKYNIIFVDSAWYSTVPDLDRIHVVIGTGLSALFGHGIGGYSLIQMLGGAGNSTAAPPIIFSDELSNNAHNIALAIIHELGHYIVLYHQADVNTSTCTVINSYTQGRGLPSPISASGIMGSQYNSGIRQWMNGSTPISTGNPTPNCFLAQNDDAALTSVIGYPTPPPDQPEVPAGAFTYTTAVKNTEYGAVLSTSSDMDTWKISPSIAFATTPRFAASNISTVDIAVDFYASGGTFLFTLDDSNSINIASCVLTTYKTQLANGYVRIRRSTNNPYEYPGAASGLVTFAFTW